MIDIRNVSRRYGSTWALRNVNLQIEQNSVVGLLGQNGAGKTTLLNVITGFLAPSEGRILIDGSDILLNAEIAKSKIGYLPEVPPLYDEMTAAEYLRFVAQLRGVRGKVSDHVNEILHLSGLWEMRNRLLGHLSKGYRQRAGLAGALCGDCEILVLDEPTSGLDPKQITETRQLIRLLAKNRIILFSSHMLPEVEQLCDRVIILHEGTVRLDSPIDSLCTESGIIRLKVTLGAPKDKALPVLQAMDGLRAVQELPAEAENASTFHMEFSETAQPEKQLFSLCCGHQLPILRLQRESNPLEQVFLNVITGERSQI